MSENDFEAIRRLRAADGSGVGELYDRFTPLLYPVLSRILGDRSRADDALRETWVTAWRGASEYDAHRGSVAAWLLTIARTIALDRSRNAPTIRRGADAGSGREPSGIALDDAAVAPEHRQLAERARRAIGALEPKHRRVLECAYFDGLSQAGTATKLGAPLGAVKTWTRQALTRLRELLPGEEWT